MKPLIPHFIQQQFESGNFSDNLQACTLFADISGFTPITQTLMLQGGKEGAEVLSEILNHVFSPMIEEVYRFGGFIPHFAGDAFTAIFPITENAPSVIFKVLQCAQHIQVFFDKEGAQETRFGQFRLSVKTGIAIGEVKWGITGATNTQYNQLLSWYFKGAAIDNCALAQQRAESGEIVLHQSVVTAQPDLFSEFIHQKSPEFYHLTDTINAIQLFEQVNLPPVNAETVLRFQPYPIAHFSGSGEFREVVSVFLAFDGMEDEQEFNEFATQLQQQLQSLGGYLKELDYGDKGSVITCFWGAPVALENDAARALNFVDWMVNEWQPKAGNSKLKIKAGISSGVAYAGIIGGKLRCQYCFVGNAINLAARLMLQAEWQQVLVNDTIAETTSYDFTFFDEVTYKGFWDPVPTYFFRGPAYDGKINLSQRRLIGRKEELRKLINWVSPLFSKSEKKSVARRFRGITYIYGEAGMGKSRLIYAFKEEVNQQVLWLEVAADNILGKPFHPFKKMLARYFNQNPTNSSEHNQREFESKWTDLYQRVQKSVIHSPMMETGLSIIAELERTKSVLAAQLGIYYENSLWSQLGAKSRYENVMYAVKNLLKAESLLQPMGLIIENLQWLDTDSINFMQVFCRNLAAFPIFIIATARYRDDGTEPGLLLDNITVQNISVEAFTTSELQALAEDLLGNKVDSKLTDVLQFQAKGNPFFAGQLLTYFIEQDQLELRNDTWHMNTTITHLPESIHAILRARIDRLSAKVKEVVKTASVIGLEFDTVFLEKLMQQEVNPEVKSAASHRIWQLVSEVQCVFNQVMLRNVAYDMQLRSQLRQLHEKIARLLQQTYKGKLAPIYADIAYHFEKAGLVGEAVQYYNKAADHALDNYQSHQAVHLYSHLQEYLEKNEGYKTPELMGDVLRYKAEALINIGEWKMAEKLFSEALEIAKSRKDTNVIGDVLLQQADLFMKQGHYQKALKNCTLSHSLAKSINFERGRAASLMHIANINFAQGNYHKALEHYNTLLPMLQSLGDEAAVSIALGNLSSAYNKLHQYDKALDFLEQKLVISQKLNAKPDLASAYGNMAIIQDNLGKQEIAMEYYKKQREIGYELGDKEDIMLAVGNMGWSYADSDQFDIAIPCLNEALELGNELGYKYGIVYYMPIKALCFIAQQKYEDAKMLLEQSYEVATQLNSLDQIFEIELLQAQIDFGTGEIQEAGKKLQLKLLDTEDALQQAQIYDLLWQFSAGYVMLTQGHSVQSETKLTNYPVFTKGSTYQQNAIQLYEKAYQESPQTFIQRRLNVLYKK